MSEIKPVSKSVDIVDLLREWSEKEPQVCKKTFLPNVFELYVEKSKFINIGREAQPDRLYLINLAIEEGASRRGWCMRNRMNVRGEWFCVVYAPYEGTVPRDPYATGQHPTRAIALLQAYLKALGGEDA